jgi:hypothetical protein
MRKREGGGEKRAGGIGDVFYRCGGRKGKEGGLGWSPRGRERRTERGGP